MELQPRQSDLQRYIERTDAWCPSCGYKLQGITVEKCPECGNELILDELIRSRYAPRMHVATGFGFLISSIVLSATIVLMPLGLICFGLAIWWAAAQDRFAQMTLDSRKRMLYLSWAPVIGVALVIVSAVLYSLL